MDQRGNSQQVISGVGNPQLSVTLSFLCPMGEHTQNTSGSSCLLGNKGFVLARTASINTAMVKKVTVEVSALLCSNTILVVQNVKSN